MKKLSILIVAMFLTANLSAQTVPDETQNKIKQLEAQVQTILVELEKLKKASQIPAEAAKVEATKAAVMAAKQTESEKKPIGIEVGNGIRLTPYGTIYFNAFGNSGGSNNADVPIFATPTGSGNVSASVRQTRFGFRLEGARVGKAKLTGVFEGDFFGGFPSISIRENFGLFRVRLAYARLDWEKTTVTIG